MGICASSSECVVFLVASVDLPVTARFHKGRSAHGHDFGVVYKDFAKNIRKPFHSFASRAFREFEILSIGV